LTAVKACRGQVAQDGSVQKETQAMTFPVVSAGAALLCLAAPAMAASPAETGALLAQRYCAVCHVVTPNASQGWTNAPSFETLANRPDQSAAALSRFIQVPHGAMLNTDRPTAQADAIAAYIMSLCTK